MASYTVTNGNKVNAADLNNLYTRLNTMRANHLTASQQAGTSTSGITSAFPTSKATVGNKILKTDTDALLTEANAIKNSGSFRAQTNASTVGTIAIPAVGALIQATNSSTRAGFNDWNTVITAMEGVCANYSRYGSRYGSQYGSHYGGHYGGHYGSHYGGHYSHSYSWYTQRYSKTTKVRKVGE